MALNFGITGVAGYVAPRHLGLACVLTNVTTPRAEVNRRALFDLAEDEPLPVALRVRRRATEETP